MPELYPPGGAVVAWSELELDKVTELISRKVVSGDRQMLAQVYLKRGALVPLHRHDSEQMTYVLDGRLKVRVDGEDVIVREGEVIRIPSGVRHQAEALADTFELDCFSPVRDEWIDPGPR
ncbi:MAG: cupin domain-containing protein [Acidobacteria bacterium]|nr:cupin domain-containing protein [Acidobacteriota bacterium]